MTDAPPQTSLVAALQAALAGEHAAVWACGRAAGEFTGGRQDRALRQLEEHRDARDGLRVSLVALGADPVGAAPSYVEPFAVTDAKQAARLLGHVGMALSGSYADIAAASARAGRREAVGAARRNAVQAVAWGAPAQALPGRSA